MKQTTLAVCNLELPVYALDTLVVGSGCAGLNAADWLVDFGRQDIALVTEGFYMGTSRNTGSDKQTYYKLSLASDGLDSVQEMAQTLLSGGGVHGDIALAEAANSVRCFIKLANLGVPFPTNEYGEYVGYKTDHDPRQRATSAGPLTSKLMTEALEKSVRRKGVRIFDRMMAVHLLTDNGEIQGLLAIDLDRKQQPDHGLTLFAARHVILATGGPAGIYADSVYPCGHTGMTGMALEAGAKAVNLQQWQYGLASVDFRWNVSGTYQQVLPRYISVDADGVEREFLPDYFETPQQALDAVFLKGYQWPFDVKKVQGSSMIDLIVHHETTVLHRRVYLDFRRDPIGLTADFTGLSEQTREYLRKSDAFIATPLARLQRMNPDAIALYEAHGISLAQEPLRIAVCAQHCNGGLAVDANWQTTITGLYAAGEIAGTFGAYRPGGSALNSTQVGALRAAQHICRTKQHAFDAEAFASTTQRTLKPWLTKLLASLKRANSISCDYHIHARQQRRMSDTAALLRDPAALTAFAAHTHTMRERFWTQFTPVHENGIVQLVKTYDMLITQEAVLDAMCKAMQVYGSHGAGLVLQPDGAMISKALAQYGYCPEKETQPAQLLLTAWQADAFCSELASARPYPAAQDWFETVWRDYRARMEPLSHSS